MGKWIDRAALTALIASTLYVFFLNAGFGIPLSCLSAFAGMCLGRYIWGRRPRRHRVSAAQAEAALSAIADMDAVEGKRALKRLARRDLEGGSFIALQRHPSDRVTAADLFDLHKAHRGEDRLVVAATCPIDPAAVDYVRSCNGPGMTLLDSSALCRAIRKTGLYATEETPERAPWRPGFIRRILTAPFGPGPVMYGVALTLAYLVRGGLMTLLAGLLLLGVAGTRFIHARRGNC